ncbi:MAG: hypothetical protein AAF801_12695 [Pseudomonadota bacterium]
MSAEPQFPLLAGLGADVAKARSAEAVPEGKGGFVFVDGKRHRILDLSEKMVADSAFAFSVNEKELVHLCAHIDVIYLGFKGLRTTTIAPIATMTRLRRLDLWWVQKLADLTPLSGLLLDVLTLDDIRYANDISALADIHTLKALKIAGGMSTTQHINTLEPLTALPDLRELQLEALKLGDDSLRPLERCKALTDLWLPNTLDVAEYAYLAAMRPDIRSNALAAYQVLGHKIGGKDIMVTGKRRPFLNSKVDAAKMAKYQARFDALVAGFHDEAAGG